MAQTGPPQPPTGKAFTLLELPAVRKCKACGFTLIELPFDRLRTKPLGGLRTLPIAKERKRFAFTLIELLVVVGIIGLLTTILMPAMAQTKALARQVTCMTRLNAQLSAVQVYASDADNAIPCGPDFPLYGTGGPPTNQVATNNIWIGPAGTYNAHGVLLEELLPDERAMFCPDDDTFDPVEELAKIRGRVPDDLAYCSYFYRQLDARDPAADPSAKLDNLGCNAAGDDVRALVMDANSKLEIPGCPHRTNHKALKVAIGFAWGNVAMFDNVDGKLTLAGDATSMFDNLDAVFERADLLQP